MFPRKQLCLAGAMIVLGLVALACAPAATPPPPTTDAMMAQETDTAVMAQETESASMAMKETDTAMMAQETDAAMMAQETDTAMMAQETETAMMAKETESATMGGDAMMPELPEQQTAMHFADSMPKHAAELATVPEMVLIHFDLTLSADSTITVEKDGKELVSGPGKLDEKRLGMSAELPQDAGAGVYVVKYKACWLDKSCHNGQFAFVVK